MKLTFLLLALILSVQGWCASSLPSHRTTVTVSPDHAVIENTKPQQIIDTRTAVIAWVLTAWLLIAVSWTLSAKRSLDDILKDVLRRMARLS